MGGNGTISASRLVNENALNEQVTITANEGYKVGSIKIDTSEISLSDSHWSQIDNKYTFDQITTDHQIIATFEPLITYSISTSIDPNSEDGCSGTISSFGDSITETINDFYLTINPDPGCALKSTTINDQFNLAQFDLNWNKLTNTYTLHGINSNISISALFL